MIKEFVMCKSITLLCISCLVVLSLKGSVWMFWKKMWSIAEYNLNYLHWSYCYSSVIFNCSCLCQSVCRWILKIPYAAFLSFWQKLTLFASSTNVINGMCKGKQFLYLRYCIEGLITPHHSLCSILITLTNQIVRLKCISVLCKGLVLLWDTPKSCG